MPRESSYFVGKANIFALARIVILQLKVTAIPSSIDTPTLGNAVSPTTAPIPVVNSVLLLNTTEELYEAVDLYVQSTLLVRNSTASLLLPPINKWDVSQITNMTSVFSAIRNPVLIDFTDDLNQWNMSNVRYMRTMFLHAEAFNGDISTWDTSNVIDMFQTFASAYKFNQDLSSWNVTNVQLMSGMVRIFCFKKIYLIYCKNHRTQLLSLFSFRFLYFSFSIALNSINILALGTLKMFDLCKVWYGPLG
jgi:surface protein